MLSSTAAHCLPPSQLSPHPGTPPRHGREAGILTIHRPYVTRTKTPAGIRGRGPKRRGVASPRSTPPRRREHGPLQRREQRWLPMPEGTPRYQKHRRVPAFCSPRGRARGCRPCLDTGSSRGAWALAPQRRRRREAACHRGHAGPGELIKFPLQTGMRRTPIARRAVETCLWQHIREIGEPRAK